MTDQTLTALLASHAVLEQLVINLTHLVSREYADSQAVRTAIVDDIRFRLEAMQRKPARESQQLACLALEALDRIEPRILGDAGAGQLN